MNKAQIEELRTFPGGDLVAKGLADLKAGIDSEEALLVMVASSRLRGLGLLVKAPRGSSVPYEHELYGLIERRNPRGAHSIYNALIRRIVSFAQAYGQCRKRDSSSQ